MATAISPSPQALILKRSSVSTSVCFPSSQGLVSAPQTCSVSVNFVSSIRFPKSERLNRSPAKAQASSVASFSQNVGDFLGYVSIFTATGGPVKFRDLWDQKQGMAVVALLRHFGCPCCWELASVLKESKERFDSAGVKLIAVGVGTPSKARILAERDGYLAGMAECDLPLSFMEAYPLMEASVSMLPFPIDCLYADPDHKAYDVLGLYYGVGRTFFNPASAKVFSRFETLRNAVKNYTIEATPDDRSGVLQQGGMFVFRGKELLYARKDEGTGDHAPLDDIINICCKVPIS